MASAQPERMDESDLRSAHRDVLDVLQEGRATKGYLIERTGYSRNTIYNVLEVLEAAGHIEAVHEPTRLFELVDDPRTTDAPEVREPEPSAAPSDDLRDRVREWVAGHPPRKDHGKEAILLVWRELREHGELETGDLKDTVYPTVSEHYGDKIKMWNSLDRYLEDVPGVEKAGYGKWGYAGDETARDELA